MTNTRAKNQVTLKKTKAVPSAYSHDLLASLYLAMCRIRQFELKARDTFRSGQMPGFIHVYVGEEAVAAGVCAALEPSDYVTSTHRGHGHAIAKGISTRAMMAELMGMTTGCSGGRGGSMHLYDPAIGFLGSNGVVPPGILIAAGAALAAKLKASDQVAVSFFGDGAVSNGAFHEGLNMAATWKLPMLFVCENNLYATETPFESVTLNPNVASRASLYGVRGTRVDGNDVLAVYDAAREAVTKARAGLGPSLLECMTYRWFGHHEGDPGTSYRAKEEIAFWKNQDAIERFRARVIRESLMTKNVLDEIDRAVANEIDDCLKFALSSKRESSDSGLHHVYSNPNSNGDGGPA